jgi:hypothetical protein
MKTFNINYKVRIKLTDIGSQIVFFRQTLNEMRADEIPNQKYRPDYSYLTPDENGYITLPLSEAIEIFGLYTNIPGEEPFNYNFELEDAGFKNE